MTGVTPTSLHIRYRRLKAALARVSDEHMQNLRTIKERVDQEIEDEKLALEKQRWSRVATQLEAEVGVRYDVGKPSTYMMAYADKCPASYCGKGLEEVSTRGVQGCSHDGGVVESSRYVEEHRGTFHIWQFLEI